MRKRRKRKLKKWVYSIILIFIILIIVGSVLIFNNLFDNRKLKLVKNLEFELGSSLNISDLITNNKVEVTNLDEKIDTTSIGNKDVIIFYKENGKSYKKKVTIQIIDNENPIIDIEDIVTISINNNVDIIELIGVQDNSKEKIIPVIKGEYDLTKEGNYNVVVEATDSSGNVNSKKITIKVLASISYNKDGSLKDGEYTTSKGYTLKVENGIATVNGILIVNKTYSLPSTYETNSPYKDINRKTGYCTDCIEDFVMKEFLKLKKDAKDLGLNLRINSGFRSYDTQKWLYDSYVSRDSKEEADTYSARAGHSEHQSGLCFDLNSTNSSFTNTKEGKWVNDNCYKYGFIIRFPEGKEKYTGYNYESWHLRYVGNDLAEKLYNNGDWISLEEYFGLTSKYPN